MIFQLWSYHSYLKDNKELLWIDKNLNGWQSNLVCLRSNYWSIDFYIYIYTNNLSGNLKSNVNLFADDTSMFSVVRDPINTSQKLKTDFDGVSLWANIWKMSFNPDQSEQAQKVILLLKINKVYHPPFLFNNSTIQQISTFRDTSSWRAYVQTSY